MKHCLHGQIQNLMKVWIILFGRLSKIGFVGFETLKFGVTDPVLCFKEGSFGNCHVFKCMGITPGKFTIQDLKRIDKRMRQKVNTSALEIRTESTVKKKQL